MKNLLIFLLLFAGLQQKMNAQGTVLSAGDIAILNYQSDTPDAFSFVTFVDLVAGTTIYFTDCGTFSAGTFVNPCTEGAVIFVTTSAVSAGTTFRYVNGAGSDPEFSSFPASSDAGLNATGINLATAGDQIIVFQDTDGTGGIDPSLNPKMIFALQGASTQFTGDPNVPNQTALPAGLTVGVSAVAVGAGSGAQDEVDNAVFNGTGFPFEDIVAAKAAILNPANWVSGVDDSSQPYAGLVAGIFNQILPIELTRFSAQAKDEAIELQWTTISEKDNQYFTIEKSLDGDRFRAIGTVKGAGTTSTTSNYRWNDRNPFEGLAYYRLKQVDYSGTFDYSNVISIRYGNTSSPVKMFPNPANRELNLQISGVENLGNFNELTIQIYSSTSQLLKVLPLGNAFNGVINFPIDDLPAGMYTLSVKIGIKEYFEKLIIGER